MHKKVLRNLGVKKKFFHYVERLPNGLVWEGLKIWVVTACHSLNPNIFKHKKKKKKLSTTNKEANKTNRKKKENKKQDKNRKSSSREESSHSISSKQVEKILRGGRMENETKIRWRS